VFGEYRGVSAGAQGDVGRVDRGAIGANVHLTWAGFGCRETPQQSPDVWIVLGLVGAVDV